MLEKQLRPMCVFGFLLMLAAEALALRRFKKLEEALKENKVVEQVLSPRPLTACAGIKDAAPYLWAGVSAACIRLPTRQKHNTGISCGTPNFRCSECSREAWCYCIVVGLDKSV